MTHLRTFATTLLALAAFTATTALAQDVTAASTTDATVAAVNTLTVESGGTVTLAPTLTTAATADPTALAYETNDGVTYKVVLSVDTGGWNFVPATTGSASNAFPVLTVDSVTSTEGTPATGPLTLIDAANALTDVDVVSGLVNVNGTASVTLGASITETVVAGTYDAGLTYTWTGQ